MFASLPLTMALFSVTTAVYADPTPPHTTERSLPLYRRGLTSRNTEHFRAWAKAHRESLMTKYGGKPPTSKRSTGTNLMTNQNSDSSFYGSLAIGTPPVAFNVILDTGSADLWIADSNCRTGCNSVPAFNPSSSSSFLNKTTPFSIVYGSGQAAGALGQDVVQMAGFSVSNQIFGVCDEVSSGLLNSPVSGLLGLGFQTLASSGATPLWETLVENGAWDQPVMSFQLTRYVNDSSARDLEPGGTFTMGFLDSNLYNGEIEYINIPSGLASYWILPLTALTVQGNAVSLPSGSDAYCAIDTGTTLVGGPSQYISEIFAQIPGSQAGSGDLEGYYTYPCATTVNVQLSFGGKNWSISPADFQLSRLSRQMCVGAFFDITTGDNAPSWIIGDTFLKNVYSVFRYNPASVGFAELSDAASSANGADAAIPSPTIGSISTSVSASNVGQAGRELSLSLSKLILINLMVIGVITALL